MERCVGDGGELPDDRSSDETTRGHSSCQLSSEAFLLSSSPLKLTAFMNEPFWGLFSHFLPQPREQVEKVCFTGGHPYYGGNSVTIEISLCFYGNIRARVIVMLQKEVHRHQHISDSVLVGGMCFFLSSITGS